jgi:DNA-binding MarR family transcriptional regulator
MLMEIRIEETEYQILAATGLNGRPVNEVIAQSGIDPREGVRVIRRLVMRGLLISAGSWRDVFVCRTYDGQRVMTLGRPHQHWRFVGRVRRAIRTG